MQSWPRSINLSACGLARAQERGFDEHDAYGLSKLAVMMITREVAERVQPPPTVNCLDPGTVNTKMLIAGKEGHPLDLGVPGLPEPEQEDMHDVIVLLDVAEMLLAAGGPSQRFAASQSTQRAAA